MPVITINGEKLGDGESTSGKHNRSVDGSINQLLLVLLALTPNQGRRRGRRGRRKSFQRQQTIIGSESVHLSHQFAVSAINLDATHQHSLLLVRNIVALHRYHVELLPRRACRHRAIVSRENAAPRKSRKIVRAGTGEGFGVRSLQLGLGNRRQEGAGSDGAMDRGHHRTWSSSEWRVKTTLNYFSKFGRR